MYQPIYDPHSDKQGYYWCVLTCAGRQWFATYEGAWRWLYQHGLAH